MDLKISVGNSVWWMLIILGVAATILLYLLLCKKSEKQKCKALLYIDIAIMILFYVQRFFMFRCEEYIAAYGSGWKRILTEILPLNLCYLSVLLMIIGVYRNNKHLLGFCFYISLLGAILALAAPVEVFTDTNLFIPAVALFYLLHILLMVIYCNVGLLGLAKPNIVTAVRSVFMLGAIAFFVHLVNLLGRTFGIENMNYFYTFDTEGSEVLDMFWKWLPVPYFYLIIPAGVIFFAWVIILTLLCKGVMFLRKRKVKTIE